VKRTCVLICATFLLSCLGMVTPAATAQGIQVFGPVDVRNSQSGASYTVPVTFNTNTLTLNCTDSPITAKISGTSDGSGRVLVDNYISVSSTSAPAVTGDPNLNNICKSSIGQTDTSGGISYPDCFTTAYQGPASGGSLDGLDVDSAPYPSNPTGPAIVTSGGIGPIDVSNFLTSGSQQLTISLEDEGGKVASSSVYLITNCTLQGVQNGGVISGNPINSSTSNPQTSQDFNFNPIAGQGIGFDYDVTAAYTNNTVTANASGAIPQVADSGLEPSQFAAYVSGTPFATSSCLIHSGELVNGLPACKLFTLTCTSGSSSSAAGANCPVSSLPNEVLRDVFDGPPFTLADITVPNGPTFHEGMGFLMASEPWTGGACQFSSESGLQDVVCPQNLLTSFSGPGSFTSGGQTTHPNSTFVSIYGVPEPLTTVIPSDANGNPVILGPGNWTNNPSPNVVFSSQPPYLTGTYLPNASAFVAAPVNSITYGISLASALPSPGNVNPADSVFTSATACPSSLTPSSQPLPPLVSPAETFSVPEDGNYLIHYHAEDCAGTEEFKYVQDNSTGSWSTNFYTFPINVDTRVPEVAPIVLSPSGPYYQGQVVTASYSCTDPLNNEVASGVVSCGGYTFSSGEASTGNLTSPVNTTASGAFTVNVADAAGNTNSSAVSYTVNIDSQIQFSISTNAIVYPLGTEVHVQVLNTNGSVPTGSVIILDNGSPVATLTLKKGSVYYYLANLSAGQHSLNAEYLGDANNKSGYSAALQLTVSPVPVTLTASCWNTPYPYGANYQCGVYASSNAGAPQGSVTYSYDGGAPVSLALVSGSANIVIPKPPVGTHTLIIRYPAQTNYAAAGPISEGFVVTAAPVNVQLTPSSWYVTGGNVTLAASIASWSAGPPSTGTVTFLYGSTILGGGAVPVSAGNASITIPATSLPNGTDTIQAVYANGTNYASGNAVISLQVAVPPAP
jgi:uncharacterized protein YaiE (UPF0345 family)